jgi:hypothetical protein
MRSFQLNGRLSWFALASLLCGFGSGVVSFAQNAALNFEPAMTPFAWNRYVVLDMAPAISELGNPLKVSGFANTSAGPVRNVGGAVPGAFAPSHSTVEVRADARDSQSALTLHQAFQGEIQASAGTYGDFTRYLQMMPGATGKSDASNDVLVRGGNPSENLYVVDGLEVPNINHLSVEGTTGGFTSMIDTDSISDVDLQTGASDARFSSRLSSVIEIHTRDRNEPEELGEVSVGIAGAGGFWERPLGAKGSMFLSAHRSLLNLVTKDIGLNGVPIYTNGLGRFEWTPREADRISFLSIDGADSINVSPCAGDPAETLTVDTQYGGSRGTNGAVWQHLLGAKGVSTLTFSHGTQEQDINQQNQMVNGVYQQGDGANHCNPVGTTPIYSELSRDRFDVLGYSLQRNVHGWLFSAGESNRFLKFNYAVQQPAGAQSPFNSNAAWTDADSFNRAPSSLETGSFAEITGQLGQRWTLMSGIRAETFQMPSAHVFEPRASLGFRISQHQTVNAAYRRSSQLPSYMDLLSYAGNRNLLPMQAEQFSAGADLWRMSMATVSVEAYRKTYANEPESMEYPSLMLANMVDNLGQQFTWLPLKSGGKGESNGVELVMRGRVGTRMRLMATSTYSRTKYSAADGVMRSGNFDLPFVGNAMMTYRLPGSVEFSLRDTYSSGRPYTPFNLPLSIAQQRGIYDLSQVNGVRGSAYNRLDFSANRNFHFKAKTMNVYGGLQNALNRNNFLGYAWLPRCIDDPTCSQYETNGIPMQRVNQMPLYPSGGARFTF